MKPGGNRRFLLLLADGGDEFIPPAPTPLSSSSSSSSNMMAITALIILLGLFFFGVFAVYIRRAISGLLRRSPYASASVRRPHGRSLFPPPAHGLDHLAVRALPVLRYVGGGGGQGKEEEEGASCCCVVCLCEFEEMERVKVIPRCGHAFHPACIDAWLLTRGSCPVCRCADVFASRSGSGSGFLSLAAAATEHDAEGQHEAAGKVGVMRRSASCSYEGAADEGAAAERLRRSCSL